MSGSGRAALLDVREWSGGPFGCTGVVGRLARCPGVVERLSQMTGVVGRLSRMSRSGREALLDVKDWSGDPYVCSGVVKRLSRMSLSGGEAHPDVRE